MRVVAMVIAALVTTLGRPAWGQDASPVSVDDSPWALQNIRQAEDQIATNPGQAARLSQTLLDQMPLKLVQAGPDRPDHYITVRERVHRMLRSNEALLTRYRQMQGAAAQERLDRGEAEAVALALLLTPAGLEAQLRLANADVEMGRFRAAASRLREIESHPDLAGSAFEANFWGLRGTASIGMHDAAGVGRAREALGAIEGELATAALALIERMEQTFPALDSDRGVTTLDSHGSLVPGEAEWHWIWSDAARGTLTMRSNPTDFTFTTLRERDQRRRRGAMLTASAAVQGSYLYVNEGTVIRALDRFSHREHWSRLFDLGIMDRDGGAVGDLNLLSVKGDALVALTGFAYADERTGGAAIVRLDARTGEIVWQVDLRSVPGRPDLSELFPHGQPLIVEDAVYVMARKVTAQLESIGYVLGLDLATGELRWAHFLSSCSGVKLGGTLRSYSTITEDQGDLFVATSLGAVARLHAADGRVVWLNRMPVPVRTGQYEVMPWEIAAPVVTARGVLVITPDQTRVVLVDRESGAELESYPTGLAEPWGEARYILAEGDLVFAVGSDVAAFNASDLSRPIWKLSSMVNVAQRVGGEDRSGIRGRVHLASGTLIVPGLVDLLLVEAGTGGVKRRIVLSELESPGNPLAAGPQVILVTADRVDSYMPYDEAERLLRSRVAEAPDDPERALALLELGMRARRPALCMEAAELGRAAVERGGGENVRDRDDLFEALLALHDAGFIDSRADGDRLHGLIGAVASTTEQRLEHLLASGNWLLSQDRRAEAVERWQTVLTTPALAEAEIERDGAIRPGRDVAMDRLRHAAKALGEAIYAAQAEFAQHELERLRAEGGDAEAVLQLASNYALSEAAIDALELAAPVMIQQGRWRAALGTAVHLLETHVENPERCAAVLEQLIPLAEAGGCRDLLAAYGMHIAHRHPELQITLRDQRVSVGQACGTVPARLPRLGASATGRIRPIEARLVPWLAPASPPSEWCLVTDGSRLTRLDASLNESWSAALSGRDPIVGRLEDGRLTVLLANDRSNPGIMSLDAQTGDVIWALEQASERLPASARAAEPIARGVPDEPVVHRQGILIGDVFVGVASSRVILVRSNGDVAALAIDTGEPSWSRPQALARVLHAAVCDAGVLLAGVAQSSDPVTGVVMDLARIVVLDVQTGAVVRTVEAPPTLGEIESAATRWIVPVRASAFAYGTEEAVEVVNLLGDTGRRTLNLSSTAMGSLDAWATWDHLLLTDAGGDIQAMSIWAGGRGGDAYVYDTDEDFASLRVRDVLVDAEGTILHCEGRVVVFDAEGRKRCSDANATLARDYLAVQPVEGGRVLVVNREQSTQVPWPDGSRRTAYPYTLFQIDRPECRMIGAPHSHEADAPPSRPLEAVQVIDGWVLLSTATTVYAMPMQSSE
jgi:outer membrane protein assembly factor BamB